ncbi:MAG: BON domain-containing protein [Rubripirellula sp.]
MMISTPLRTNSGPPEIVTPQPAFSTEEAVQTSLDESPYSELHRVRCEQQGQELTILRGSVSSYFLKQLAQETVMNVAGVGRVVNFVQVRPRAR